MMRYCLERRQRTLAILMVIGASLSTTFLVIAICSDHLVNCHEKYMGKTSDIPKLSRNLSQVYILTNFGFWRTCSQFTDVEGTSITIKPNIKCQTPQWQNANAERKMDRNGEEENITYSITAHPLIKYVVMLSMLGLCMEVVGHSTCLVDHKCADTNCYMFITGVWYVLAGLSLLAAVIVLTGVITEESMHQKELPDIKVKLFRYYYASSFYILALSFCCAEMAAIMAIYLFIVRYKESYKKQHARLHVLKSQTQLVSELLSKIRKQSVSTTEGSRRPSYQPFSAYSAGAANDKVEQYHSNTLSSELPELSSHLSPTSKSEQEYKQIVNSETVDSGLYNCNGYSNNGLSVCESAIPPPFNFENSSETPPKRVTTTV